MRKYIAFLGVFILFTGCSNKIVSPDLVSISPDEKTIWLADRQGNELIAIDKSDQKVLYRQKFPSPVNDILLDPEGRLWVVCDGKGGALYELNPSNFLELSKTPLGYTPSAITFNEKTGTLWITQRFLNEVWEIDPASKEIVARIGVGREPVDIVSVRGGDRMLVVNNLPAMASVDFPVATHVDVINTDSKKAEGKIMLPNGSTDARSIAVSPDGNYAYITHLLARYQLPTNQVDRGWMSTNTMSVIDLNNMTLETTVLLDTPQRGAANPTLVAISPDGHNIVVALSGSHELSVINRGDFHDRLDAAKRGEKVVPSLEKWEDIPNDAGFLYGIREFVPTGGKGPRSFAFSGGDIVVPNYFTGEIAVIDSKGNIRSTFSLGDPRTSTETGLGEMYFYDATLCFQQWQSCGSCHPNDARVDGINWDLLNDGVGNPKNTKSMLYSHKTGPCMVTGIRKDAETAVRSGLKFIHFAACDEAIASSIDTYLKSLTHMESPYLVDGKLSEAAQRGKVHFDKYCASCHSGQYYTDLQKYPVSWTLSKDNVPMDVSALIEMWRTAPYLYDGRSYTIREMLNVHGPSDKLASNDLDDLAEYVLSL